MITIRADGSIPGPDQYGRAYKVINQMTGQVGYNLWGSDLPAGDPYVIKNIERYSTFAGWVSDILPINEVEVLVGKLNLTKQFVDTPHTLMIKRIRGRMNTNDVGVIDGFDVIADIEAMYKDIMGAHLGRPPIDGW
jgi:hypothetical protein